MKIRNGFVSNSSSSSFAIIGTIIDYDSMSNLEQEQLTEKVDLVLHPGDCVNDVPGVVAGFVIVDISDDGNSESGEMSLEDFNYYVDRLIKEFDVKREEVKIYSGTMMA